MNKTYIEIPECDKKRIRNSYSILTAIILTLFAAGVIWQPIAIIVAAALLVIGCVINADMREVFHV